MAMIKVTYHDGTVESFDDSWSRDVNKITIYENVILIKGGGSHEVIIPITRIKRIEHYKGNE